MMSVTRQAWWVWCGRAGTAICCKVSTADTTEPAKQQVNPLFMLKCLSFGLLPLVLPAHDPRPPAQAAALQQGSRYDC